MQGLDASPDLHTKGLARVQAATVRVRDAFVAEKFGPGARERYRHEASAELRELLVAPSVPRSGWVPFELFAESNELADRLFGKGDLALSWDVGRFAAAHESGVWRNLVMRHLRPAMLISVAAGLWSHHYDGGRMVTRASGRSSVFMSIVNFPQPHRAHCLSIGGWMQGSLELRPGRNVRVRELTCRAQGASTCSFRADWSE